MKLYSYKFKYISLQWKLFFVSYIIIIIIFTFFLHRDNVISFSSYRIIKVLFLTIKDFLFIFICSNILLIIVFFIWDIYILIIRWIREIIIFSELMLIGNRWPYLLNIFKNKITISGFKGLFEAIPATF